MKSPCPGRQEVLSLSHLKDEEEEIFMPFLIYCFDKVILWSSTEILWQTGVVIPQELIWRRNNEVKKTNCHNGSFLQHQGISTQHFIMVMYLFIAYIQI